jgi:myo-inositol-hexaphosphate 3-phosphohydrolase
LRWITKRLISTSQMGRTLVWAKWEELWGMSFHPDKCKVLRVVRSKKHRMYKYHLKGHQLEVADTTKYLGVDLSYNLSWNHHIDCTVKKENSMLGFLKRNLKIGNQDTKSAAYFSLVRPNLEYCVSIWNPYSIQSIKKLEIVQRRAARYVTNRYQQCHRHVR